MKAAHCGARFQDLCFSTLPHQYDTVVFRCELLLRHEQGMMGGSSDDGELETGSGVERGSESSKRVERHVAFD